MIGRGTIVWLALAIVAGIGLFQVSYRVQSLEDELTRVNRQILQERDTIHVLRAEWSYLNEPTRLAELTQRHLALSPLGASQMVRIEDLPLRLPALVAETTPLPATDTPAAKRGQSPSSSPPPPLVAEKKAEKKGTVPFSPETAAPPPTSIADLINRTSLPQ